MRITNTILDAKLNYLNGLFEGKKKFQIIYQNGSQALYEVINETSGAVRTVSEPCSKSELANVIDSIYNATYSILGGGVTHERKTD